MHARLFLTKYWYLRHLLNASVCFFRSNAARLILSREGETAPIDFLVTLTERPALLTIILLKVYNKTMAKIYQVGFEIYPPKAAIIDCPKHLDHKVWLRRYKYVGICRWRCNFDGSSGDCPHRDTIEASDLYGETVACLCKTCGHAISISELEKRMYDCD